MKSVLLIVLLLIIVVLIFLLFFLFKKSSSLYNELSHVRFSKNSQSIRYGKISEQFFPLTESFPYEKESFRFIGSPIDGIAFTDDEIVFCEFKAANSKLSQKQKRIKELIQKRQVNWREFNLKE